MQIGATAKGRGRTLLPQLRCFARWAAYAAFVLALLIAFWMRNALYNRWVRFPGDESAWKMLREQREPLPLVGTWHEYRGILHSHSKFSHDCEVSFEEILQALKETGLDFICLSDHCVDGLADFDWQWRGLHQGKLFIPGFEMRDGFMPFGAGPGTVLSNRTDSAALAKQVLDRGGVLFYAHPEETRDWELPELTGMEIYNIHSDFKRYPGGLRAMLPNVLLNQKRFPEHVLRLIFQRPTEFLRHWDELNARRHITGIAGNDCHQNTGLRGIYTSADKLRIEDTGRKVLTQIRLNWFTRWLARAAFGLLKPDRELFHLQLDPYARIARFVNTHVLARELSEPEILGALRSGRVFIGFDLIADSAGFQWWANAGDDVVVMGESGVFSRETLLHARSPLPCRFTIVQNGHPVYQGEGRNLEWTPSGPGKYRVEAELRVRHDWVPWVYANPIELRE
jgi:hypothetical protein